MCMRVCLLACMYVYTHTSAALSVSATAMHLKPCRTSSTKASDCRRSLKHTHRRQHTCTQCSEHTKAHSTVTGLGGCTTAARLTFPSCTQISPKQFQETWRRSRKKAEGTGCTLDLHKSQLSICSHPHLLNGVVHILRQCCTLRRFAAIRSISCTGWWVEGVKEMP